MVCTCGGRAKDPRPKPKSFLDEIDLIASRIREIAKDEGRTPTIDNLGAHPPPPVSASGMWKLMPAYTEQAELCYWLD